jgi:hypothetical protein
MICNSESLQTLQASFFPVVQLNNSMADNLVAFTIKIDTQMFITSRTYDDEQKCGWFHMQVIQGDKHFSLVLSIYWTASVV